MQLSRLDKDNLSLLVGGVLFFATALYCFFLPFPTSVWLATIVNNGLVVACTLFLWALVEDRVFQTYHLPAEPPFLYAVGWGLGSAWRTFHGSPILFAIVLTAAFFLLLFALLLNGVAEFGRGVLKPICDEALPSPFMPLWAWRGRLLLFPTSSGRRREMELGMVHRTHR